MMNDEHIIRAAATGRQPLSIRLPHQLLSHVEGRETEEEKRLPLRLARADMSFPMLSGPHSMCPVSAVSLHFLCSSTRLLDGSPIIFELAGTRRHYRE